MAKKTDEQKMLFNHYVSVSTIQRYFGLEKNDAIDVFHKVVKHDVDQGYLQLFDDKVRTLGVFELLGLDLKLELIKYSIKNNYQITVEMEEKATKV